jgi:RNA polymerase sigma-70 factor (ECF subfamily)
MAAAMTTLTSTELVLRAQGRDSTAFGELVRRHQASVYAAALEKLRDPSEAQETAHEAFVKAFTKLGQLREPAAFVGWVRRIAVRLALNRLTRRKLNQAEEGVFEGVTSFGPTPLEAALRAEARMSIWNGLARLNQLDRDTLVAFYVRGQSIREMAARFATPEGTIKRRLHVARNRLKAKLEARDAGTLARKPRSALIERELMTI